MCHSKEGMPLCMRTKVVLTAQGTSGEGCCTGQACPMHTACTGKHAPCTLLHGTCLLQPSCPHKQAPTHKPLESSLWSVCSSQAALIGKSDWFGYRQQPIHHSRRHS
eukprot:1144364-Pelagomonas_calceolata.AAC.1